MPERDEALNEYLQRLRREAGLTLTEVCERTKIQIRYVEALEAGRYGELPSNTHLRAFSLALVHACGGDSAHAGALVRQVLNAVQVQGLAPEPSLSSAPFLRPAEPAKVAKPAKAAKTAVPSKAKAAAPLPPLEIKEPEPERLKDAAAPVENPVQDASQRLKALPWQALVVLVGGGALLSLGLVWAVHAWKARVQSAASNSLVAPSTVAAVADLAAGHATAGDANTQANGAATDAAAGQTASAQAEAAPMTQIILRARRDCWLVLEIDGQRLPTITMKDGDKMSWGVRQKAVLLAGNIGALRVWWRGDNLGYLGELGSRGNGLVFEAGKSFRVDKAAALSLPPGVPE